MDEYGTVIAPDTLRLERTLPGPIERVWTYLTDSAQRGKWLASGDMDLKVGGRVELIFRNSELTPHDDPPPRRYAQYAGESRMIGTITACDPPRLLRHTWREDSGEDSEVSFELAEEGDAVKLVLTHRRLANRPDMLSVAGGWHTHLGILEARLGGRTPEGFWSTHTRLEAEYDRRIPQAESQAR